MGPVDRLEVTSTAFSPDSLRGPSADYHVGAPLPASSVRLMIVDIHTHPPRHRELPPRVEPEFNGMWRPDRPVKVTTCWDDYLDGTETGRSLRRLRHRGEPIR